MEGAADAFEHGQNAAALLRGVLGHDGFERSPGNTPVDLRIGPGDPVAEILGTGVILQQMRKDLARALMKKRFSRSRSGKRDFAMASASVWCKISSAGVQ